MIKVNQNTCIGCGACVAIDSDHFGFNDAGLSEVVSEEITDSTREAAGACPVGAIEIEEGVETEKTSEEITDSTREAAGACPVGTIETEEGEETEVSETPEN